MSKSMDYKMNNTSTDRGKGSYEITKFVMSKISGDFGYGSRGFGSLFRFTRDMIRHFFVGFGSMST
jgi:hypothetical protein